MSAVMVWPCDQNVPRKIGEASPAGYTNRKAAQTLTKEILTTSPILLDPALV